MARNVSPTTSPIVRAMRRARAQLLAANARRAAEMVRAYAYVWRNLQSEIADLESLLAQGEDRWYVRQRARALQRQVEIEMARYAQYADGQVEAAVREGIAAAGRDVPAIVRAAYPVGGDVLIRALWHRLPLEAVENALGMLGPRSPLRRRMNKHLGPAVAEKVSQRLIEGVAQGWSPRYTHEMLRRSFGAGLNWSLTQVRTAHVWAYREATRANYTANGHIVKGWTWRSARDPRTCMECIAMDGTEHSNAEPLNDHYNGRCWAEPVLPTYEELGIEGPPVQREETGIEWFNRQPEAVQQNMMGPRAWEAWRAGQFDLRDYVRTYQDEVYGEMRRQATLRELLAA